jgi:hypothetical protein
MVPAAAMTTNAFTQNRARGSTAKTNPPTAGPRAMPRLMANRLHEKATLRPASVDAAIVAEYEAGVNSS